MDVDMLGGFRSLALSGVRHKDRLRKRRLDGVAEALTARDKDAEQVKPHKGDRLKR